MKLKIPGIKRESEENPEEMTDDEVLDELESTTEETPIAEPEHESVKSYGMVISESQLRMIWAGEIGFSLLAVLIALIAAFLN